MIRFVLISLLLLAGCTEEVPTIAFVVPNGFEGLILVSEGGGSALVKTNGTYTVQIPKDGQLFITDLAPFNRWHKEKAAYSDGQDLPVIPLAYKSKIALFQLSFRQGRGIYYFVGTEKDYELISRSSDFYKFPLATKIDLNNPK